MDALVDKVCELERELEDADQEIARLESTIAEKTENELLYLKAIKELKVSVEEHAKDRQSILQKQRELEHTIKSLSHDKDSLQFQITSLESDLQSTNQQCSKYLASLQDHQKSLLQSSAEVCSLKSALSAQELSHKASLSSQEQLLQQSHRQSVASLEQEICSLSTQLQGCKTQLTHTQTLLEQQKEHTRQRLEEVRERELREAREGREGRDGEGTGVGGWAAVGEAAQVEARVKYLAALRPIEEAFQAKLVAEVEAVREGVTNEYAAVVQAVAGEKAAADGKVQELEKKLFELECLYRKLDDAKTVACNKLDIANKEIAIINERLNKVIEERDYLYKQETVHQETTIRLRLASEELGQIKKEHAHLKSKLNECESEKETLMFQIKATQSALMQEKDKNENERDNLFGLIEELKNNISELQEKIFLKEKQIHQMSCETIKFVQDFKSKLTNDVQTKMEELNQELADQKHSISLQTARFWQFCSQLLPKAFKKFFEHTRNFYHSQLLNRLRELESTSKETQSQDKARLFDLERQIQQKEDEISDLKEGNLL